MKMERNVDRNTSAKCDDGGVLAEGVFEEIVLVPDMSQERDGIGLNVTGRRLGLAGSSDESN